MSLHDIVLRLRVHCTSIYSENCNFELRLVLIKMMEDEMSRTFSTHGRVVIHTYESVVRKPERKRPFGIPRCRWWGNIKMDLTDIWREGEEWTHVAQGMNQ
jgi:hypothetical protein